MELTLDQSSDCKNIFVLLGTHIFPFDRLLDQLEEAYESSLLGADVFITVQCGHTNARNNYTNFRYINFLNSHDYNYEMCKADLVISHGGAGSIFDALLLNKKLISLPRLTEFHENVDNHQLELTSILFEKKHIIAKENLLGSFKMLPTFQFVPYHSNRKRIISLVEKLIDI